MSDGNNKLRIGWFTFTCCEDSTIMMTELLNEHFFEWKDKIDFVHMKVLQTKNKLSEMDVAFVEGAISSDKQAEKLKTIRSKAKKLVAIGACACIGNPSNMRNKFDEATKAEIQFLIDRFKYMESVKTLSEVVKVDHQVQGCPMDTKVFLELINQLLAEQRA